MERNTEACSHPDRSLSSNVGVVVTVRRCGRIQDAILARRWRCVASQEPTSLSTVGSHNTRGDFDNERRIDASTLLRGVCIRETNDHLLECPESPADSRIFNRPETTAPETLLQPRSSYSLLVKCVQRDLDRRRSFESVPGGGTYRLQRPGAAHPLRNKVPSHWEFEMSSRQASEGVISLELQDRLGLGRKL